MIVVLVLANRVEGGVAAYQWAFTFFYLPHALFAVPVFNVLFTAMSEHAARSEDDALVGRLRDGLGVLAFILIPVAALLIAAAGPLARLTLEYGVMTESGAELVARVIAAFAIGLPTYSIFLVLTRAYYAVGNTKTPALVNAGTVAVASIAGTVLFFAAADRWSVAGLALGHSLAFALGAFVLGRAFARSVGQIVDPALVGAVGRALLGGGLALAAMLAVHLTLPDSTHAESLVNGSATAIAGVVVYTGVAFLLRSPELARIRSVVARPR